MIVEVGRLYLHATRILKLVAGTCRLRLDKIMFVYSPKFVSLIYNSPNLACYISRNRIIDRTKNLIRLITVDNGGGLSDILLHPLESSITSSFLRTTLSPVRRSSPT
jgi:hypothetical protein